MDYSMQGNSTSLTQCPYQSTCMVGTLSERPCPSFRGIGVIDGLIVVNCISSERGIVVPCPSCHNAHTFKFQHGLYFDNWLCKSCGFYLIPGEDDIPIPHEGFTIEVLCECGARAWLFPETDMRRVTWKCHRCGIISPVEDVIVHREDDDGL